MPRLIHAWIGSLGGTLVFLTSILIIASCDVGEHDKEVEVVAPPISAPSPPPALQAHSSWPGVSYLEVRAYYSREPFENSFRQSGVPDQVDDKDGVLLDGDQKRRLISAVTSRVEPYATVDCWWPHHAFVFWDPLGNPVAEVDICFGCLQVKGGPSDMPDIVALADLVSDLGLPLGADVASFQKAFESARESATRE